MKNKQIKMFEENEVKPSLPYNLQFFASEEDDGKKEDEPGDDQDDDSDDDDSDDDVEEKTFTQSQVSAMMAREKKEGKKAILNALGFKSLEQAKKSISETNKNKNDEKEKNENETKNEALLRAERAENKLTCIMAGVNKESIEDALAIALNKVDEDTDLEEVLEEMKKQKKYSGFFDLEENEEKKDGTGRKPGKGDKEKKDEKGEIGKRLAKNTISSAQKKSAYF